MNDGHIRLPPIDPALRDAELLTQQQVIYNKIMQKKDSVRKIYKLPFKVKFANIEDLHRRIMSAASSYGVITESHTITVSYIDNGSHQYPSFEKFKFHCSDGASSVSHVNAEYNFYMLSGPNQSDNTHYKIVVDISSHLSNFYCDKDPIESFFWKKFRDNTAMTKIEYVDYFIAQNFENILSKWFSSLEVASETKIFDLFQRFSHYSPRFMQLIISASFIYSMYLLFSKKEFVLNINKLPELIVVSCGGLFILYSLSWFLGKGLEYSLDRVCKLSYIELNDGDKALIAKHGKESSKNILRISIYLIAFVFNVFLTHFVKVLFNIV